MINQKKGQNKLWTHRTGQQQQHHPARDLGSWLQGAGLSHSHLAGVAGLKEE